MKKILSLILTALFVMNPAVYALPAVEKAERAEETVILAEEQQTAELKPGINIWTGTGDVQDFEGDDVLDHVTLSTNYNVTIDKRVHDLDPANVVTDNNAVKITKIRGNVAAKNFPLIEKERPVKIEFDYIYNGQIRVVANETPTRTTLQTHALVYIYQSPDNTTHWQHFSGVRRGITEKGEKPNGEYRFFNESADLAQLYIAGGTEAPTLSDTTPVYIDNVSMIPYYKISYVLNGGAGEYPDNYFLGDRYDLSAVTEPTRSNHTFLGWSLTNGGAIIDTSYVEMVPGKDVTLYAVWEASNAENAVKYTYTSDKAGVADGEITVTLTEDAVNYTSAEILLADDNGILENYTPFATLTFNSGVGSREVSGNRVFPAEATRLAAKLSGEGLEDIYYWYTIPEERRLVLEDEPRFTFWALSDLHLNGKSYNEDYWPEMPILRANAMADVIATDADFAFINGDLICYGDKNYLDVLQSYFDDKLNNPEYNKNMFPFFTISGNHEYYEASVPKVDNELVASYYNRQVDYLEENYGDEYSFVKNDGGWETWYAVDSENVNMVFLQNPEPDEEFTFCDKQLRFLDNQLYKGEKSNKTNFVIIHRPLANTIPSSDGGYVFGSPTTNEVNKILAKHPNTIVFSAHTHSDLSAENIHFTVVNDMTTKPSHINDGSLVNTHIWGTDGYYKDMSTGVYLEVYSDKIYVRSRKFTENPKYFGHGAYVIDIPDANTEIFDVSMTGEMKDGAVFTAYVNGEIPADDAPYTYEWSVRNEIISTEKSFVLDAKGYFADEHIALRVYDENGNFASCITEKPFKGVNIKYELGDATGDVPPARTWIAGTYMQPEIGVAFPKKEGKFFKGWSTKENDTKPMAEILITADTTYYPVFDDVPEFYFDANLSGFTTNGVATDFSITDGIWNIKAETAGDLYFTWRNSTFDADKYRFMRIKSNYQSGSPDSVYFSTETAAGWAGARGIQLSKGVAKAEADGMTVKEYDLKSINANWTGTITGLRFDALASIGNLYVDYIIFSENAGIYNADVTVISGNASVSANNCSVEWFDTKDGVITVVLAPDDGYEFTEEFIENVTINGEKATEAVLGNDGTAKVIFDPKDVPVTNTYANIGDTSGLTDRYTIDIGKAFEECTVIAAAYGENGRLLDTAYIPETNDIDGKMNIFVERALGALSVKVFVFEKGTFSPISEITEAHGNLIVNGDAEDASKANVVTSENAVVSIVNDSEMGNVWDITPKSEKKDWIYFIYKHNFKYVPGATYEVTFDVKIAGTHLSDDISAIFHPNTRYICEGTTDHIAGTAVLKSGSWNTLTYTFTVDESSTDRSGDQFCFYADPVDDAPVHYLIDNIDLRIVG